MDKIILLINTVIYQQILNYILVIFPLQQKTKIVPLMTKLLLIIIILKILLTKKFSITKIVLIQTQLTVLIKHLIIDFSMN